MSKFENENVVYVFNHLQRSAGGALAQALAQRFRIVADYQSGPDEADLAHWLTHPVALDQLHPGDMLMGHYTAAGGRLHQRYPEVFYSTRYRLVTFVREPLDWVESQLRYFNYQELGAQETDGVLEVLAGTYSRTYCLPIGCRRTHPLEAYWFAGAYSRDALDARRLLRRLEINENNLQLVNPSAERYGVAPLNAEQRERYRNMASSDFDIYEWVKKRR